jgi:hypothetical protein
MVKMGLKNKSKKQSKNKIKKQNQRKSDLEKGFQMDEVHVHLICHCSVLPMMKINKNTGNVEIPVPNICPVCHIGTTTGVVIGGMICDTDAKCPHPGCTCTTVTMQLPHNDFLHFIRKGREDF